MRHRPAEAARGFAAALAAVFLLAGAGLDVSTRSEATETAALLPSPAPSRPPRDRTDPDAATFAAVREVLDVRSRAMVRRDRAAFVATIDPANPAFLRSELAMFDALAKVPLAEWTYTAARGDELTLPDAADARYPARTYASIVTLRYRYDGFDETPATVVDYVTFTAGPDGRWRLASETDFGQPTTEFWDGGRIDVVRGRNSLVLGHPGKPALLRLLADEADAAVPRVSAVWGTDWARKLVVIVPKDVNELGALLGDRTDLDQIAAVAIAQRPGEQNEPATGNRIIVNPSNVTKLGALGRRVVMTHEATHVATRDLSNGSVPEWLVEGFADYVGYLGTGIPVRSAAAELRREVRAGRVPTALPPVDAFDGSNSRLAQVYEMSWLAVRYLAERIGQRGVVDFYRTLGRSRPGSYERVLRGATGMTPASFVSAWSAYVRRQLR